LQSVKAGSGFPQSCAAILASIINEQLAAKCRRTAAKSPRKKIFPVAQKIALNGPGS
jgi:hypothetical protein